MNDCFKAVIDSPVATTLLSASVGALLSIGSAYLADDRKARREDAMRFQVVREQAYGEFLGQIAKAQFSGWPATPLPQAAAQALWLAKARVELHSDEKVNVAATSLITSLERPTASGSADEVAFSTCYSTLKDAMRANLKAPKA